MDNDFLCTTGRMCGYCVCRHKHTHTQPRAITSCCPAVANLRLRCCGVLPALCCASGLYIEVDEVLMGPDKALATGHLVRWERGTVNSPLQAPSLRQRCACGTVCLRLLALKTHGMLGVLCALQA